MGGVGSGSRPTYRPRTYSKGYGNTKNGLGHAGYNTFRRFLIGLELERMDNEMGGCGGKKRRERAKQVVATIDGNFNSTGNVTDQAANRALVVKLMAEVIEHYNKLSKDNQMFLSDCRIKLNMYGNRCVFGWRQVEKMVTIHKEVTGAASGIRPEGEGGGTTGSEGGEEQGNLQARQPQGRDGKVGTPSH